MRRFAFFATTVLVSLGSFAGRARLHGEPAGAPVKGRRNLIANGGFEHWRPLTPAVLDRETVRNLRLVPSALAPVGWLPAREVVRGQGATTLIARDDRIRHSGKYSVRIENRDMRDIAYVSYSTERYVEHPDDPHNVRPNRRYLLRWWVRGRDIDPHGTGPLMMMFFLSDADGQRQRTDAYEKTTPPKETFAWQQRRFVFITGPHAKWATFTFQLRWTTGTVWYDDVELVDTGPVTPVETY